MLFLIDRVPKSDKGWDYGMRCLSQLKEKKLRSWRQWHGWCQEWLKERKELASCQRIFKSHFTNVMLKPAEKEEPSGMSVANYSYDI